MDAAEKLELQAPQELVGLKLRLKYLLLEDSLPPTPGYMEASNKESAVRNNACSSHDLQQTPLVATRLTSNLSMAQVESNKSTKGEEGLFIIIKA